jgi:hypothetical protein
MVSQSLRSRPRTHVKTVGRSVYAVKPVRKLSSHAPAIKTLVGLLETRAALATFAAMNCDMVHALGAVMPVDRVK